MGATRAVDRWAGPPIVRRTAVHLVGRRGPTPIATPGPDSGRVAGAQVRGTVAGPGEGSDPSKPARKRVSLASLGWAVLAVAVLAAAVATPLLLHRHRNRQDTPP